MTINILKGLLRMEKNVIYKKIIKRKGVALPEYAFIAILFALTLGIALFQIGPDVVKDYFIRSMDEGAAVTSGKLKIKPIGE